MSDLHLTADPDLNHEKYQVGLSMVEFEEDNVTIIYSPALDLSGYGYNYSEAKQSFKEALHEFFRYTSRKKTLQKVLKELGWSVTGSEKKPQLDPPKDSDLVSLNPLYNDIVNTKSYKVSREDVEFTL